MALGTRFFDGTLRQAYGSGLIGHHAKRRDEKCGFPWSIIQKGEPLKPPRGLKITDLEVGVGRPCVPGDTALCHCTCRRSKGEVLFTDAPGRLPSSIQVGFRNYCVGIEYGLLGMRVGGRCLVVVPPSLTYVERRIYPDLSENSVLHYELQLIDLPGTWDPELEGRLSQKAALHAECR